jgi:hypothetical protein
MSESPTASTEMGSDRSAARLGGESLLVAQPVIKPNSPARSRSDANVRGLTMALSQTRCEHIAFFLGLLLDVGIVRDAYRNQIKSERRLGIFRTLAATPNRSRLSEDVGLPPKKRVNHDERWRRGSVEYLSRLCTRRKIVVEPSSLSSDSGAVAFWM